MKHTLLFAACAVVALFAWFGFDQWLVASVFGLSALAFGIGAIRTRGMHQRAATQKQAGEPSLEQILNQQSTAYPHTRIAADSFGRVTHLALMLSPYVKDD